jgi:predicted ATPase
VTCPQCRADHREGSRSSSGSGAAPEVVCPACGFVAEPGLGALADALPVILALLDLPFTNPAWQALEPPQRRRRTLEALTQLFLLEARRAPLLLVFEDLQRIDEETQALLDGLIDRLPDARILALVTYRPEYQHGWAGKPGYDQLRVDPLGEATAGRLLDALLGDAPDLGPLRALLIRRTDGNPLFLEESVRALAETEVLAGARGAYRLARSLTAVPAPTTVQAVLAARIDRLPREAKHLLQCAAVVGRDVPFAVLEAVADLPPDALRTGLRAAAGRRVPPRDAPLPGARAYLQARADPRGRVRGPAP